MLKVIGQIAPSIPGCEIEFGIKRLSGILNSKGILTLMSCEGHIRGPDFRHPWISVCPAHFQSYLSENSQNLQRFLKAGEGRWKLTYEFQAKSVFPGIGRVRPRLKNIKRKTEVELEIYFVLLAPSVCSKPKKSKSIEMKRMERAALRYL